MAASADGAVVGAGHGRPGDRQGRVHVRGPGPGGDPQLQRGRVRLAGAELRGGRPPTFTLPQRREIKKIALSRPTDHDLPFSTWSLSKLAEFLVAEGVVDDISHEGLAAPAPRGGRLVSSHQDLEGEQRPRLRGQEEPDPRALRHRRRQGRLARPGPDGGDLHGRVRAAQPPAPPRQAVGAGAGGQGDAGRRRRRRRATYTAPHGVRHLLAAYDLSATGSTGTSRSARAAPSSWRSAATSARCTRPRCASRSCWTTSARTCPPRRTPAWRLGRREQRRVGLRAVLRVVAQPDRGPVHRAALLRPRRHRPRHPPEQARMIRRYIAWRNRNAHESPEWLGSTPGTVVTRQTRSRQTCWPGACKGRRRRLGVADSRSLPFRRPRCPDEVPHHLDPRDHRAHPEPPATNLPGPARAATDMAGVSRTLPGTDAGLCPGLPSTEQEDDPCQATGRQFHCRCQGSPRCDRTIDVVEVEDPSTVVVDASVVDRRRLLAWSRSSSPSVVGRRRLLGRRGRRRRLGGRVVVGFSVVEVFAALGGQVVSLLDRRRRRRRLLGGRRRLLGGRGRRRLLGGRGRRRRLASCRRGVEWSSSGFSVVEVVEVDVVEVVVVGPTLGGDTPEHLVLHVGATATTSLLSGSRSTCQPYWGCG